MKIFRKNWLLLVLVLPGCLGSMSPDTGEWVGKPSVSFVVKEKGQLSDFSIVVPLAMGECKINVSEIPVNKNGEINFTRTGEMKNMILDTNEYFSFPLFS